MSTMREAASEFLAHKRIAVTGVSRTSADHGSNTVFRSDGQGSVSPVATAYGRAHGITVIDGGCPLMFDPGCGLRSQGHAADLRRPRPEAI